MHFTPKIRNRIPGGRYERELKPFTETASASKRNFSQLSATSEDRIRVAMSAKKYKDNKKAWVGFVTEEVHVMLQAYIKVLQDEVESTNQHIKFLIEKADSGEIAVTEEEKMAELERLEQAVIERQSNLVVLREQHSQFVGEFVDDMITLKRHDNSDWAYIDLLISRYKTPDHAKVSLFKSRNPDSQERFRRWVLNAYDATRTRANPKAKGAESDQSKFTYCCIAGEWYSEDEVKIRAAHIVPYNIGEVHAGYLFGPPDDKDGHLMSARNGIPMRVIYKREMDNAQFSIVPVENSDDLKVMVLDPTAAKRLDHIDGRILGFRNDFRPAKHYLYFAYVSALLRRQRLEAPGWWRTRTDHGFGKVWATPGEYVRSSTLSIMARRIGNMSSEDAADFLGPDPKQGSQLQPGDRDVIISDYVLVSSSVLEDEDPFVDNDESKGKGSLAGAFQFLGTDDDNNDGEDDDDDDEDDDDNDDENDDENE